MSNGTAQRLRPSEAENTEAPGTAEWYFMEADLTLQASAEWDIEPAHSAHLVEVAKVQAMLAQYRLAADGKAGL